MRRLVNAVSLEIGHLLFTRGKGKFLEIVVMKKQWV